MIIVTYFPSLVLEGDPGLAAAAPAPAPVLTFKAFLADGEPASSIEIKTLNIINLILKITLV